MSISKSYNKIQNKRFHRPKDPVCSHFLYLLRSQEFRRWWMMTNNLVFNRHRINRKMNLWRVPKLIKLWVSLGNLHQRKKSDIHLTQIIIRSLGRLLWCNSRVLTNQAMPAVVTAAPTLVEAVRAKYKVIILQFSVQAKDHLVEIKTSKTSRIWKKSTTLFWHY